MRLSNEALLISLRHDIPAGVMSSVTLSMLIGIVNGFSQRMNMNFGYTLSEADLEDMRQHALEHLLKFWLTMSSNPFAYYTQCVHGSMLNYMNHEQNQVRVKQCLQEHYETIGAADI